MRHVTAVEPRPNYCIWLRFDNGVEGEVDLARLVRPNTVFEPLLEQEFFAQVYLDDWPSVAWPGGIDLDADVLYAEATGRAIEHDGKVVYTPHQTRETTP